MAARGRKERCDASHDLARGSAEERTRRVDICIVLKEEARQVSMPTPTAQPKREMALTIGEVGVSTLLQCVQRTLHVSIEHCATKLCRELLACRRRVPLFGKAGRHVETLDERARR
jgi:hypothetical protein